MDKQKINAEIQKLTTLAESLEAWINNNAGHKDFEKVNRQLNEVEISIKIRKQKIERSDYPARFNFEQEYSLPNFIL